MLSFLLKVIGGLILLASWVFREIWGRKQEQLLSGYRRELDAKGRAEDAYRSILTQRRILDFIFYMQKTIGFVNAPYVVQASEIQQDINDSVKLYAIERLKHIWLIVKGQEAKEDEKAGWGKLNIDEIMKLGDELSVQIDEGEKRLDNKTRRADHIVAVLYIVGATLLLLGTD